MNVRKGTSLHDVYPPGANSPVFCYIAINRKQA